MEEKVTRIRHKALVRPKLEYSCSIWDPYTHDNINKLEMIKRQAARYVQNNYHNTSSVTSMIDTLGWPTLAERRLKTRLIMLFKITRFNCYPKHHTDPN